MIYLHVKLLNPTPELKNNSLHALNFGGACSHMPPDGISF